jgi:hypothetical protein
MINHEHHVIFIHLPKCAGTSVECALDGEAWHRPDRREQQHLTAEESCRRYGKETFEAYFKVAIVRNPWDLLVAHYLWGSSGLRGKAPVFARWFRRWGHPFAQRRSVKCPSFAQYLADVPGYNEHLHFSRSGMDLTRQRASLSIDGQLAVDTVARFEDLPESFHAACRQANIAHCELPRKLVSRRRRHYSTFYSDDTRERVAELYAEDMEFFGYRFETG